MHSPIVKSRRHYNASFVLMSVNKCVCKCKNVLLKNSTNIFFNWRASEMSETLSGVTQLKIRDICLYIICLEECMSFLYFDSSIF